MIWDFIIGPFGAGFATGAIIFGFWDVVVDWWSNGVPVSRRAQVQKVNDLYSEAVKNRLRIRSLGEFDFDYSREFDQLREWKSRLLPVARRLDINKAIDLEVLGDFNGKVSRNHRENTSELTHKDHMEMMWNEYVDRVKRFVNELKA